MNNENETKTDVKKHNIKYVVDNRGITPRRMRRRTKSIIKKMETFKKLVYRYSKKLKKKPINEIDIDSSLFRNEAEKLRKN